MREVPFQVILPDGEKVGGASPWQLLEALRRSDWDLPLSVVDFKRGVANRCQVAGVYLLFWDESSFLYAASEAKVFRLLIDGVEV